MRQCLRRGFNALFCRRLPLPRVDATFQLIFCLFLMDRTKSVPEVSKELPSH